MPTTLRLLLLFIALAIILLNGFYIPDIRYDLLNAIPTLAVACIALLIVTLRKRLWIRVLLLVPVTLIGAECALRCLGYQRSLVYERQGELLYTPKPDQDYLEKISLTRSHVNHYGLRGGPVDVQGRTIILCLGDSVTYGYGVDDEHTYPAELQRALDRRFPGRYAVLNAGVDGYPIDFMRQKFLYLWDLGIHPAIVIVSYSFNEGGWLPYLADSDTRTQAAIETRVDAKNRLRSFALYNLTVENWNRTTYNTMKKYAAAERKELSAGEAQALYRQHLQALYDELNAHHVTPIFALFAGYNWATGQFDTTSPFQQEFRKFAEGHSTYPVLSNEALVGASPAVRKPQYFQDQCHMTEGGNEKFAETVANSFK